MRAGNGRGPHAMQTGSSLHAGRPHFPEDIAMARSAAWTGLCAGCLSLPLLLGACATEQQRVATTEDRLATAGFVSRPADTPQREAMLQRLPADHFARRDVRGRSVYLYADPLVCGCLYVGSEQAYDRYREQMVQQHLAGERQLAVQIIPDPDWSLDGWGGPWGPGFENGFH